MPFNHVCCAVLHKSGLEFSSLHEIERENKNKNKQNLGTEIQTENNSRLCRREETEV